MTTRARGEREKEERRQSILRAARGVFFENGFHRATADSVAERAEVSKGTVYLYFESKETILAHLLLDGLDELTVKLKQAYAAEQRISADERVRRLGRAYRRFFEDEPQYFRLLMAMDRGKFQETVTPQVYQQVLKSSMEVFEVAVRAIEQGIEDDLFDCPDPRRAAVVLWATLDGTVTPANACPISDGAAAMIVCTAEKANEHGLKPTARIVSYAYAAVDPAYMGIGPAFAVPKALKRAGLALDDIGLIELNEAFAAQVLADAKEMETQGYNWDWARVNVNGGAIALGHPVGCTAAKLIATLTHEMQRREVRYGLDTMCVGGGQGGCLVMERIPMD